MDPSGGRWLCLDRTRKSGPYDRLFIDTTGNGRLDDKTPVPARLDSYNAIFPPTPVVFKGEDGPVTYHLVFRFYQYDQSPAQFLASSGGWYEGTVNFDGVKKRIQLIDGNVNGTFNDMAADPFESDRMQVDGDKTAERFLGRMLEVDGKFFNDRSRARRRVHQSAKGGECHARSGARAGNHFRIRRVWRERPFRAQAGEWRVHPARRPIPDGPLDHQPQGRQRRAVDAVRLQLSPDCRL